MIIGAVLIYVPAITGNYLVGRVGALAGLALGFYLAIKLMRSGIEVHL